MFLKWYINCVMIMNLIQKVISILSVMCMLCISEQAFSQNFACERGYKGNVKLENNIGVTKGFNGSSFSLTTSHGFGFGDGFYVGAGTGIGYWLSDFVSVPIYLDVKYNILDSSLSPYAECRMGWEAIFPESGFGSSILVHPEIGVDIHHFTFGVGYKCNSGSYAYKADIWHKERLMFKHHVITVSIAYNF